MKIFVASSSNYVAYDEQGNLDLSETRKTPLGRLVKGLRKAHFLVEPWWEDDTLAKGGNLLDGLIIKARTCDGGIFIFGKDDLLIPVENKSISVPRDNVILECGMFFGSKGKSRTLVITDGTPSEIKIPSDIFGTNLPDLKNLTTIKHAVSFFSKVKEEEQYHKFTFYFNSKSIQEVIEKKYLSWSTKSLYIGAESARKWKAIESDRDYLISRNVVPKFIKEIFSKKKVDFKNIDNVVSFGPGCGIFDNSVVSEIYKKNQNISYIPIDINPLLAFEASSHINKKNPKLRVPFAIIDDFEENYDYVADIIKKKFNEFNQVNLFLMLGGTFSNLAGIETDIVQKLMSWMDHNDFLIIDAFIKADLYSYSNDNSRHIKGGLPQTYKDLMINACIKRYFSTESSSRDHEEDIKFYKEINSDLSKFLIDREEDATSKLNFSEIDETSVVTYNFKKGDISKEILIAKRYKFERIRDFLEENFKLIHDFDSISDTKLLDGRGLFLLQKK